jgi:hypothetical protein
LDESLALSCLNSSLELLETLVHVWIELDCAKEIFCAYLPKFLLALPRGMLNKELLIKIEKLEEHLLRLQKSCSKKAIVTAQEEKTKPKILKLFEPQIENG